MKPFYQLFILPRRGIGEMRSNLFKTIVALLAMILSLKAALSSLGHETQRSQENLNTERFHERRHDLL